MLLTIIVGRGTEGNMIFSKGVETGHEDKMLLI